MDKILKKILYLTLISIFIFNCLSLSGLALSDEEIYGNFNTLSLEINYNLLNSYADIHPKMHFDNTRLNEIKNLVNTDDILELAYNEVLKRARWGTQNDPPETIDTASYDQTFSYVYEYIPSLALAYKITDNEDYLENALKWINKLCDYPVWEAKPDLATGIALTSLGLAYDWLYNDLTTAEKQKIKNKMLEQGEIVYIYMSGPKTSANRSWLQNHMWIPVAGLACAAISLYGEEQVAESWLERANKHISTAFSWMPDDGVAHEGMDYFFYGMESLFIYADLAYDILGINYFETIFLKNVSDYILYSFYPESSWNGDEYYSTIGDTAGVGVKAHMIKLLAKRNNDGVAQWLANRLDIAAVPSGHPYFKILWYDENVIPEAPDNTKPLLKHFDDLDFVFSRTGWTNNENMLIFKSGLPMGHKENELSKTMQNFYDIGAAHVHPDNNSFILHANGEVLIRDDKYAVPKYTYQHNTLTVDGIGQAGDSDRWFDILEFHDENGYAGIKKAESLNGVDYIIGDAAGSYRTSLGLTKFDRHLIFIKPDILIVLDDIELFHSRNLKLRFWPQSQNISAINDTFTILSDNTRLDITNLSKNSDKAVFETETVYIREDTEERKSISFTKKASKWTNAVALSWSDKNSTPASIDYESSGSIYKFETENKVITVDIATESFTVDEYCDVNISMSGNGSIDKNLNTRFIKNQYYEAKITPDTGHYIEYVKINGSTIISDYIGEYDLSTLITGETNIDISFKEIPYPPQLNLIKKVYDAPGYGGIVFGKINDYKNGFEITEYGIVFSKTNKNPIIGDINCIKYRALVEKNALGQFGIQFKGNGIKPGITYFARPYMIYKNNNEIIVEYSEPIAFTPQSVSVNSFLSNFGINIIPFTSYEIK